MTASGGRTPVAVIWPRAIICAVIDAGTPVIIVSAFVPAQPVDCNTSNDLRSESAP